MISLIIFLIICLNLHADSTNDDFLLEPVEPVPPVIQTNTPEKKKLTIKDIADKKEEDLFVYNVITIFQDNTTLKGIITFPENSIKIKHKKKGFIFEKVIYWDNIKSIKILEWHPKKGPVNKGKQSQMFYFYPSKYKIIMKKGKVHEYNKNIPYLNKLVLTNDDGSANIFSYFVDYWSITGENSGFWRNSRSTYFYAPIKKPHKQTIKIINFQ